MTGTVSELFQNCDNWGAKEWFERLVDAIKRQDECVLAKDEIGFQTFNNIAASSAMCLAREHAGEVLSALTASASEPAPLPDDLFSHRDAWRRGLVILRDTAECDPPIDDKAYWQHELDVFDRVFATLQASTVPASEPEPVALERTYYTEGKDCPFYEALSDKEFAWEATKMAQDLADMDTRELEEILPFVGVLSLAADRIERLANPVPTPDGAVGALRNALEPFAKIADEYADQEDDDFQVWKDFDVLGATLPLKHFRAARTALEIPWQKPGRAAQAQAGEKPDFPADEQSGETSHGAVTDAMVEAACMANINPLSTPSDTERRKMRAALTAALSHPADGWRDIESSVECHGLDTPVRVCFYEQDFYVLSNFSSFQVILDGIVFDTSEAAYHFEKFPGYPGLQQQIQLASSAHEAFKLAERNKHLRRSDWDDVKVDVMRSILRAKVAQHEYVSRKLLATGDRELVENSWRDDFWGWGPNRDGKNMLGKLWMEVRAELRAAKPEGE